MAVVRFTGKLLLLVAIAVLAYGFYAWLTGADVGQSAGRYWFATDPSSLNLLQASVQRYIHPAVWDGFVEFVLRRPFWEAVLRAFVVLFVLGGLLLVLGRRRGPRRGR